MCVCIVKFLQFSVEYANSGYLTRAILKTLFMGYGLIICYTAVTQLPLTTQCKCPK